MKPEVDREKLIEAARAARANAYCPYSGFAVGAALLADSGRVYAGANCESASYGAVICAERAALTVAVTAGERRFAALAVAAGDSPTPPCGICRQFMKEFCSDDFEIISLNENGAVSVYTMEEILPEGFKL